MHGLIEEKSLIPLDLDGKLLSNAPDAYLAGSGGSGDVQPAADDANRCDSEG